MARLLTRNEERKGWAAFCCPDHGFLVATFPSATVRCGERVRSKRCKKRAVLTLPTKGR